MNFGPTFRFNKSKKLATAERTDCHHEGASADLLRKTNEMWLVEFLWAVNGEAPLRTAQYMHEHGYLSRVRPKVRVQVLDLLNSKPVLNLARLNKINHMEGEGAFGAP